MNTCEHVGEVAVGSKLSVRRMLERFLSSFQLDATMTYLASLSLFTVLNGPRFDGGPRAIPNLCLGIPAHVPPGSFVLTVVPPVSGLRDEQGDVVTGQEVQ